MMWFYKLSRRVRNIIVGILWGVTAVATAIVGVVYGGNTENAHPAVAVVVVAFLTAAIVFTVFASKATAKEKATVDSTQADKEKNATAQAEADMQKKLQDRRNIIAVMPDGGVVVHFYGGGKKVYTPDEARLLNIEPSNDMWAENDESDDEGFDIAIKNGVTFPIHTKAVGVTFGNHQANIAASVVGDALIIKHAPFEQYTESTDILNARTGERVGHIKKELAFALLDEFGAGFALDGEIADITGGTEDAPTRGCNIVIDGVRK